MNFLGLQFPPGNSFLEQLFVSLTDITQLLIELGGSILLILLFWYLRKTRKGTKFEAADYLIFYFIGGLFVTVVGFFVPALAVILWVVPLVLLGWRINKLHADYSFMKVLVEFVAVNIVSFGLSLVLALFTALPLVALTAISPLLGSIVTTIVEIVIAYITYLVLSKYALPWIHKQLGVSAPTKRGRTFAVTGLTSERT